MRRFSFYSWSPDANPLEENIVPMSESMMILISMGEDQHLEKYSVHGIPYYFLRSGKDTQNDLKSMAKPFFTSNFPALRDFWNDYDAKYYYLYLSPLYYTNRKEQGGFAWGPGFVMKYSGIVDNTTIAIIAHETSHNRIGNSNLALGSNSLAHQWFGEGFTDYVCLTTLNKCGMYSDEVFMEKLNNIFQNHYTSKVNTAPNESIPLNTGRMEVIKNCVIAVERSLPFILTIKSGFHRMENIL